MTRLMFLGALALAGGLPAADYVIKAAKIGRASCRERV